MEKEGLLGQGCEGSKLRGDAQREREDKDDNEKSLSRKLVYMSGQLNN